MHFALWKHLKRCETHTTPTNNKKKQSNYQRYLHVRTCQFALCKYMVGHISSEHHKTQSALQPETFEFMRKSNGISSNNNTAVKYVKYDSGKTTPHPMLISIKNFEAQRNSKWIEWKIVRMWTHSYFYKNRNILISLINKVFH